MHEKDAVGASARAFSGWIELNNDAGQYAGPPAPIVAGNLVNIGVGYHTTTDESAALLNLWIAAIEHRRDAGVSRLRLTLESGFDILKRNFQRTSIVHAGTSSYLSIASRIWSRAGLLQITNGASSRSSAILPTFTILPQTSGYEALRQVLQYIADRAWCMDQFQTRLYEPLTGDSVDYAIDATHPLHELRLITEPAIVSDVHVFGTGVFGGSQQHTEAAQGLGTIARLRDLTSDTGTESTNTATAHKRQRNLDVRHGHLVVQPILGIEIMDVVSFADGHVAGGTLSRRVMAVRWKYDKKRGDFLQELELGPL